MRQDRTAPAGVAGLSPLERPAVRVLCVDEEDRVLLLKWRDPVGGRAFWEPPGGGIERGESEGDAARRELLEETGILVDGLTDPVARVRRNTTWAGRLLVALEPIFVVRVAGAPFMPAALTTEEEGSLLGHRWWPLDEMAAAEEEIEPPELLELFQQWLLNG